MATSNKTCAPASTKYVAEQGITMPNWLKTFENFWWHSSFFALQKQPKIVIFQSCLPLRNLLVATFNETRTPTSRNM